MAGHARVSFRDAAGKESTADLALVPAEMLAAGTAVAGVPVEAGPGSLFGLVLVGDDRRACGV